MWRSIRTGVAVMGLTALLMSGIAVAQTVGTPDAAGTVPEPPTVAKAILEHLAPLVQDGTITEEQAAAVADQLSPLVRGAAFREQTGQLQRRLGRLAGEIAEVLGISAERLGEQLRRGMTLGEIADATGSSGGQLSAEVVDHVAAHLAVQVTAGRIDQARADQIIAHTEQALAELVDVTHPFGTVMRERRTTALRAAGLEAAAAALEVPVDDLRERLQNGESLAGIAAGLDIGEEELTSAMLKPIRQALDVAVERGRIGEDRTAELLSRAADRISEAIHEAPGG